MANPFNIPDSPFDIHSREEMPCDSTCVANSSPTPTFNDSLVKYTLFPSSSQVSSGYWDNTGCFREDGTLVVYYRLVTSYNLYSKIGWVGSVNGTKWIPNDSPLFLMNTNRTPSDSLFGCTLVPLSDLTYTPDLPDSPTWSSSVYLLPATILASLFFIFLYKTFKRVLF